MHLLDDCRNEPHLRTAKGHLREVTCVSWRARARALFHRPYRRATSRPKLDPALGTVDGGNLAPLLRNVM